MFYICFIFYNFSIPSISLQKLQCQPGCSTTASLAVGHPQPANSFIAPFTEMTSCINMSRWRGTLADDNCHLQDAVHFLVVSFLFELSVLHCVLPLLDFFGAISNT